MPVRIHDVLALKKTERALLVQIEGEEFWIPQSQIHEDSEVWKEADKGDLVISDWFAEKEGLG